MVETRLVLAEGMIGGGKTTTAGQLAAAVGGRALHEFAVDHLRNGPTIMVFVRRHGFPLLRGALVGGAAYSMGRRAAHNAQREADQQADIAELQAQQAGRPPQYPSPAAPGDVATQSTQLGQMVRDGLLTTAVRGGQRETAELTQSWCRTIHASASCQAALVDCRSTGARLVPAAVCDCEACVARVRTFRRRIRRSALVGRADLGVGQPADVVRAGVVAECVWCS